MRKKQLLSCSERATDNWNNVGIMFTEHFNMFDLCLNHFRWRRPWFELLLFKTGLVLCHNSNIGNSKCFLMILKVELFATHVAEAHKAHMCVATTMCRSYKTENNVKLQKDLPVILLTVL